MRKRVKEDGGAEREWLTMPPARGRSNVKRTEGAHYTQRSETTPMLKISEWHVFKG